MIASLRGTVLGVSGAHAVIDVAGVGYSVNVTPDHALSLRVGAETTISTVLIVRDDALTLYGFADAELRDVFELLITVNGVGPKSAMGVLAVMSADDIARAVAADDDAAFRKVSGIGPKTAKHIVVSLSGKLHAAPTASAPAAPAASTVSASVVAALVGLGWPERTAERAVEDAAAHAAVADRSNQQALLRLALGTLGGKPESIAKGAS